MRRKYHNVERITSGTRRVLVAELWEGPEKECGHRCTAVGNCGGVSASAWYTGFEDEAKGHWQEGAAE